MRVFNFLFFNSLRQSICSRAISVAFFVTSIFMHPQSALANEKIGRFEFEQILLRPTYFSKEKEGGEFSFSDSSLSFRWLKDENLSGFVKLGSVLERRIHRLYLNTEPTEQLGFINVYAQYSGVYGALRAGLLPLNFGASGFEDDFDRIWPESRLFLNRYITKNDFGFGYFTENNRFYTEFIVHNGEVDHSPNDGNPWVTTRWGWRKERFNVQLSGQTGRSVQAATANGSTTLGGWDRTRNAHWRTVSLGLNWQPRKWDIFFHATAGEAEQAKLEKTWGHLQFDFIRQLGANWGVGLRHEEIDDNRKMSGDKVSEESLLIYSKTQDSSSLISLVTTKVLEENRQTPNDQMWVQWRLTPYVK